MRSSKIIAVILVVLLSFSFFGCAKKEEPVPPSPDFRNVFWGDARSVVEDSEETEYVFALDDLMMFEGKVENEEAEIYYVFDGDSLSEVQCEMVINDRTLNELIDSFKLLSDILSAQYGEPWYEDVHEFINDIGDHEGDADNLLLYHNIIRYRQQWNSDTTLFTLSLEYVDKQIMYELLAQPYENTAESTEK